MIEDFEEAFDRLGPRMLLSPVEIIAYLSVISNPVHVGFVSVSTPFDFVCGHDSPTSLLVQ
jgi:hypothetical protein